MPFNRRHRWRRSVVLSLLILVALWSVRVRLLTAAGSALVEDDGPHKAEAAVVLGGDGFGERIIKAAKLVQAGYVPFAFIGGPAAFGEHECDFTIPFAGRKGYPASLFRAVPHEADSTRSEARFFGEYLRRRGIHKIILVTSNYHTHRAGYLVRRINPDLEVDMVPAPDPFFTPDSWWKTRTGQKTFLVEWTKTFATWLGI